MWQKLPKALQTTAVRPAQERLENDLSAYVLMQWFPNGCKILQPKRTLLFIYFYAHRYPTVSAPDTSVPLNSSACSKLRMG